MAALGHRGWLLACSIAGILCLGRVALHPFLGHDWQPHATNILSIIRSCLMVAVMLWAARRSMRDRVPASPWWCFAVGFIAWLIADLIWAWLDWQGSATWGSAADLFFLSMYPWMLVGIYRLPRSPLSGLARWSTALDMAAITLAAGILLWVLVVAPGLATTKAEVDVLTTIIALAYPLGDLVLVWAILDLSFRGRARVARGIPTLLVCGLGLLVIADLEYGIQAVQGTYVSGNALGILWAVSVCLVGLAGARHATAAPTSDVARRPPQMTSPLLAAVSLIAVWLLVLSQPQSQVAALAGILCAILLVVRQGLSLLANRRLEAQLNRINDDLELRVEARGRELAAAHDRLAEAERLEAIGRVAGAIAHDFNNVLAVIHGQSEIARLHDRDGTVHKQLDAITSASQRASDLARRLIATSRPPAIRVEPVDLRAISAEVAEQLGPTLAPAISVDLALPAHDAIVPGDGEQLHQVLMNLCLNARDAMPDGGVLGIGVLVSDNEAEVLITDTGTGMDEDTRRQLFEPYFTTKAETRGTGLGLSSVRAIILQHQGRIEVETELGTGSRFRIILPRRTA